MIAPIHIRSSDVVEWNGKSDEFSQWQPSLQYAAGDRVILNDYVYEAAVQNTSIEPGSLDQSAWVPVYLSAPLRAFDGRLTTKVESKNGELAFDIKMLESCDSMVFFGLKAESLSIDILPQIFTKTVKLDTEGMFEPIRDLLLDSLPLFEGSTLQIRIQGASVSEIAIGKTVVLGQALAGTNVGFQDFSAKDQNEFGDFEIIERAYSDSVDYNFFVEAHQLRDVKRHIASRRAQPTVFYVESDVDNFGTTIFGIPDDFQAPLETSGGSICSLRVEGLAKW